MSYIEQLRKQKIEMLSGLLRVFWFMIKPGFQCQKTLAVEKLTVFREDTCIKRLQELNMDCFYLLTIALVDGAVSFGI